LDLAPNNSVQYYQVPLVISSVGRRTHVTYSILFFVLYIKMLHVTGLDSNSINHLYIFLFYIFAAKSTNTRFKEGIFG